jgi:hypothetical protein
MGYAMVEDAAAAAWVAAGLSEYDGTVTTVVPAGFEAYARILHPAGLDEVPVRWGDVAAANGRSAHRAMQWDHIVGARRLSEQAGVWDEEPETGSLPQTLLPALAGVLGEHTETPERCWYGLWTGWGHTIVAEGETATFETADREMFLLAAPLDTVHRTSLEPWPVASADGSVAIAFQTSPPDDKPEAEAGAEPGPDPFWRSPNLWWPDDRAWCVATEIDFSYTYVGGTQRCVDAIIQTPGLEAYAVDPADPVTWDGDHVNPRPRT